MSAGVIGRLAAQLATIKSPAEAVSHTIDAARDLERAPVAGVYLLTPRGFEHRARGASDATFAAYMTVSERGGRDPLFDHVVRTQSAVHERMILTGAAWDRHPLYTEAGAPAGLRHYMLAPVVVGARVAGAVAFSRRPVDDPFACDDLVTACSLATCLSVGLSVLDARPQLATTHLTPRESDVASLVVKGLTNAEIALAVGISPNYVKKLIQQLQTKFSASNRTELAVLLVGYRG